LDSEYIESLDITLFQSKHGYRYGEECFRFIDFCDIKPQFYMMDWGSGCGVLSFLSLRYRPLQVCAVELQPCLYDILQYNIQINHASDCIQAICANYCDFSNVHAPVDMIISNPPYFSVGTGRIPMDRAIATAKFELNGNLESLIKSAKEHLRPSGLLCLALRTNRMVELNHIAHAYGFSLNKKCLWGQGEAHQICFSRWVCP